MFTGNNFGHTFVRRVFVIHFVAVNKLNNIGVLLDRTGFPQVGTDRTFIRPLLQRSVKLRQGNQRAVKFFGDDFQGARNFRNFLGTAF